MQQTNFFKCRPLRYRIRYLTEPRQTSSKRFRDAKTLAVVDLVLYKARQCMRKSRRRGRECGCLIAKGDRSAIGRLQVCCLTGLTRRPTKRTREEKTRPAGGHMPGHQFAQLVVYNKVTPTCVIRLLHRRISRRRPARGGTCCRMAPARTALRLLAPRRACMALHTRFPTNRRINGVRHRTWRFLPRIRYCISKQKTSVERLCEMVSMRNASPSTPEFDGRARNAYRRQDSFVLVQWQLHNEKSVHS
ncbi:Hypothetical_protein [Hexamita inflata]|uniref:Hypothetical_protein n=1 Tax=Hexamita inflata TaxID=28002 RepID=A0AA86U4R1_9EUKA|nr:Hypothetical protein HINF_LOCUS27136 [Hexamita inflata]